MARRADIFRVTARAMVTAGFICAPAGRVGEENERKKKNTHTYVSFGVGDSAVNGSEIAFKYTITSGQPVPVQCNSERMPPCTC